MEVLLNFQLTILTTLIIFAASQRVELEYNYTCPLLWKKPCQCATLDSYSSDKIQVHCEVFRITPQYPDLGSIQSSHTAWLYLKCDDLFTSQLYNGMLQNLHDLEELSFINCNVKKLVSQTLSGLSNLKVFNISYTQPNVTSRSFAIESNAFVNTPKLEMTDMSYVGLSKVPKSLFCGLNQMKYIDLSGNSFKSEQEIGYIHENLNTTCLPHLQTLGLGYNQIHQITVPFIHNTPELQLVYLNNNRITRIGMDTFQSLTSLLLLQISHNKLSQIHNQTFQDLKNIEEVYMDHNKIVCLQPETFLNNDRINVLMLGYNQLTTECLPRISHLYQLMFLDLSYNNLEYLPVNFLQTCSVLNLQGNKLHYIPQSIYYPLSKLAHLNISDNLMTSFIFDHNYTGGIFENLEVLDLSRNKISDITLENANFKVIPNLKKLLLSHNFLSVIPCQNITLDHLFLLDINDNYINEISSRDFQCFAGLRYLTLKNNNISYVPKKVFASMPQLELINLSWNNIDTLEYGAFNDLPNLKFINLNHNSITYIDAAFVFIDNLSILYINHNLIRTLHSIDLPSKLIYVDMSYNKIHTLESGIFSKLPQLQLFNLRFNNLYTISKFSLIKSSQITTRPNIMLSGNYLFCDCNMFYLQNINRSYGTSLFVMVADVTSLLCYSLAPGIKYKFLVDLNPRDFLCQYCRPSILGCDESAQRQYCLTGCSCCDIDESNCSCRQTCPERCNCLVNVDRKYHRIGCTNTNLTGIPTNTLRYASHIYFDGNEVSQLDNKDFEYQSDVKELYLNDSKVQDISPFTFQNLSNLQILYLNDNLMTVLHSETFSGLGKLKKLYLQNNSISYIDNGSFAGLSMMQELHMENNNLSLLSLDSLNGLQKLTHLYLGGNNWMCDCNFGPQFQSWITKNSQLIKDIPLCGILGPLVQVNSTSEYRISWVDFDPCKNLTTEKIVHKFDKSHIPIIIGIIMTFLLFICGLLLIYRYKDLLQVWLYSTYGIRFHKLKEDKNKDYDAFISYSNKDESFVVRELVPMLEEGNPPYKLCVHYRNWIIGNGIADSIISSVHNSRRTILLLSRNFIESEWCNYEFQTAHHQVLKDKTCRLIVVLMEDKPPEGLDEELQLYIKSHTYICRNDPLFHDRLKFALPDVPEEDKLLRWEAKRKEKEMLRRTREAMIRLNISNVPPENMDMKNEICETKA